MPNLLQRIRIIAPFVLLTKPLKKLIVRAHRMAGYVKMVARVWWLRFARKKPFQPGNGVTNLVVSMTSFPARITGAWAAIEAVFGQTLQPDRIILTLASEEFPTKKLPRRIRKQVSRGIEILWLDENGRSYDKLLPLLEHFPDSSIVTIDDDKLIPRDLLEKLYSAHAQHPTAIVGARGWEMKLIDGEVAYGRGWVRANPQSKSSQLFMTGNGGILYPPHSMAHPQNTLGLARLHAPSADDVWFWAIARAHGTPSFCLGLDPHPVNVLQSKTPALAKKNATENNKQFQSTIDCFGLRGDLTANLPEASGAAYTEYRS